MDIYSGLNTTDFCLLGLSLITYPYYWLYLSLSEHSQDRAQTNSLLNLFLPVGSDPASFHAVYLIRSSACFQLCMLYAECLGSFSPATVGLLHEGGKGQCMCSLFETEIPPHASSGCSTDTALMPQCVFCSAVLAQCFQLQPILQFAMVVEQGHCAYVHMRHEGFRDHLLHCLFLLSSQCVIGFM